MAVAPTFYVMFLFLVFAILIITFSGPDKPIDGDTFEQIAKTGLLIPNLNLAKMLFKNQLLLGSYSKSFPKTVACSGFYATNLRLKPFG